MPKGREIETYYSAGLSEAMQMLKSDVSMLSELQPFVRFCIDNKAFNDFLNGTYFGHILQQMFYVYVYRMMMVACKVLDSAPDSWGFAGCYRQFGPKSQLVRELAFLRARFGIGVFETSPPGDPDLTKWMQRENLEKARERFQATFENVAALGRDLDNILVLDSYKRVRVFRSEKIAHAVFGSRDRRKYSTRSPIGNPELKCVLEVTDAVIDFGERFFGTLSNAWPGFRDRQNVTKEYYNDFLKQLQFPGQMEIKW